jgi:N-acetylglucosaminyldiphosphoundecaprenol N-acetyl-beta-D-mannosaminyltransferase
MVRKGRQWEEILGVRIDSTSTEQVLKKIALNLDNRNVFYITTPNPEIVLMCQKDPLLKGFINGSDYSLPDGIGLKAASEFLATDAPSYKIVRFPFLIFKGITTGMGLLMNSKEGGINIIKGREMFVEIIGLANRKGWKVFLLGGESVLTCASVLKRSYKDLRIKAVVGPVLNDSADPRDKEGEDTERNIVAKINRYKPDLLFIAFGAPKQEKWLQKWRYKLDVRGAMVVGGTFDYVAGYRKFPPKVFNRFEWLWRLITQPVRVQRVINAVVVFPVKVFWSKFMGK